MPLSWSSNWGTTGSYIEMNEQLNNVKEIHRKKYNCPSQQVNDSDLLRQWPNARTGDTITPQSVQGIQQVVDQYDQQWCTTHLSGHQNGYDSTYYYNHNGNLYVSHLNGDKNPYCNIHYNNELGTHDVSYYSDRKGIYDNNVDTGYRGTNVQSDYNGLYTQVDLSQLSNNYSGQLTTKKSVNNSTHNGTY